MRANQSDKGESAIDGKLAQKKGDSDAVKRGALRSV
jgi:hypothetical protein